MSRELLEKIWAERNPQHEVNSDTGKDMFFDTVMMVIKDYNSGVCEIWRTEHNKNIFHLGQCHKCYSNQIL